MTAKIIPLRGLPGPEAGLQLVELVDAQEMAWLYPDTFEVPCDEALAAITPGDDVKICLNEERFWVQVLWVVQEELIYGMVNNMLRPDQPVHYGDVIVCRKEHVFDIMSASNMNYVRGAEEQLAHATCNRVAFSKKK